MTFDAVSRGGGLALGWLREYTLTSIDSLGSSAGRLGYTWYAKGTESENSRAHGSVTIGFTHDRVMIDVIHHVSKPVYVHLSQFCRAQWRGHSSLRLRIGDQRPYELLPTRSDYPFGAPATFLTARSDRVELLRASSAEKGPFTSLARLPHRDPPIAIVTGERVACELTVEGFVAQSSVEESPTAGWGVPMNRVGIEASDWDAHGEPIAAWLDWSLADTAIGRGFHSVGIAAGIYRSRIIVKIASGE